MSSSVLPLLGLIKKAGRLEIGEEPVGACARARQAKLILVAGDAAENSRRRASHFAEAGGVPWVDVPFTKAEMGAMMGRTSCAMAAITDAGFAASLVSKLAAADPERYGETAAALDTRAQKALQRQKEQRRHERNLKEGKHKPWAPPPRESGTGGKKDGGKGKRLETAAPGAQARIALKGRVKIKGKLPPGPDKPA